MKIVHIDALNRVVYDPTSESIAREIEVEDEIYHKISFEPYNMDWVYKPTSNTFELEHKLDYGSYRRQREQECFSKLNKSLFWYQSLSPTELEELKTWYQAWLDVTETLVIPKKPDWLD